MYVGMCVCPLGSARYAPLYWWASFNIYELLRLRQLTAFKRIAISGGMRRKKRLIYIFSQTTFSPHTAARRTFAISCIACYAFLLLFYNFCSLLLFFLCFLLLSLFEFNSSIHTPKHIEAHTYTCAQKYISAHTLTHRDALKHGIFLVLFHFS